MLIPRDLASALREWSNPSTYTETELRDLSTIEHLSSSVSAIAAVFESEKETGTYGEVRADFGYCRRGRHLSLFFLCKWGLRLGWVYRRKEDMGRNGRERLCLYSIAVSNGWMDATRPLNRPDRAEGEGQY
jgi:hypothetical protein